MAARPTLRPLCLVLVLCLLVTAATAQEPVESGRRALGRSWGSYPWYDRANDGIRRIDVEPPQQPWNPSCACNASSARLPSGAGLEMLAWGVVGILAILAVYLLFRFLRSWTDTGTSPEAGPDAVDALPAIEELPFALPRTRGDLLAEAQRCYQRGDYCQAILYLFSYELLQLDQHQVIRLARGKTNRQYLREVGPRRSLRLLVEQTMVAFEDVFFGNRTIGPARFLACWSELEHFQTLVAEAPA